MNVATPHFAGSGRPGGLGTLHFESGRRVSIDYGGDGRFVVSLFTPCRWNLRQAFYEGLVCVNRLKRPGSPLAVATWNGCLVVALRLSVPVLDEFALRVAVAELVSFADACLERA